MDWDRVASHIRWAGVGWDHKQAEGSIIFSGLAAKVTPEDKKKEERAIERVRSQHTSDLSAGIERYTTGN
jgi:hypothetical protein